MLTRLVKVKIPFSGKLCNPSLGKKHSNRLSSKITDYTSKMQLKTSANLRALLKMADKQSLHELKDEEEHKLKEEEPHNEAPHEKPKLNPKLNRKLNHGGKDCKPHHQRAQKLTRLVTSNVYDQLKGFFTKLPSHK